MKNEIVQFQKIMKTDFIQIFVVFAYALSEIQYCYIFNCANLIMIVITGVPKKPHVRIYLHLVNRAICVFSPTQEVLF